MTNCGAYKLVSRLPEFCSPHEIDLMASKDGGVLHVLPWGRLVAFPDCSLAVFAGGRVNISFSPGRHELPVRGAGVWSENTTDGNPFSASAEPYHVRYGDYAKWLETPVFISTLDDGRQVRFYQEIIPVSDDALQELKYSTGVYGFVIGSDQYLGNLAHIKRAVSNHLHEVEDHRATHLFLRGFLDGP